MKQQGIFAKVTEPTDRVNTLVVVDIPSITDSTYTLTRVI